MTADSLGIFRGPDKGRSQSFVIEFVMGSLETFSVDPANRRTENEKGLTHRLINHLNFVGGDLPFFFLKDEPEDINRGDSPSVDIAAISRTQTITASSYQGITLLVVEAKRLSDQLGPLREREYLVGHVAKGKYQECGGVERFKKGLHGRTFTTAAMIGYFQCDSIESWINTINGWIDDFSSQIDNSWMTSEKIEAQERLSKSAKLISEHPRSDGSITLYHMWVDLIH